MQASCDIVAQSHAGPVLHILTFERRQCAIRCTFHYQYWGREIPNNAQELHNIWVCTEWGKGKGAQLKNKRVPAGVVVIHITKTRSLQDQKLVLRFSVKKSNTRNELCRRKGGATTDILSSNVMSELEIRDAEVCILSILKGHRHVEKCQTTGHI